jgi:hypothetical protein
MRPGGHWDTPMGRIHFPTNVETTLVHRLAFVSREQGMIAITFTRQRFEGFQGPRSEMEHDVVARVEMAPDDFEDLVNLLGQILRDHGPE